MKNTCLLFLLLLSICLPSRAADNYMFKYFDVGSGLSNNSVYAILKDSKGFLWLATESGLNRYDGYDFSVYRSVEGDSLTLPDNFISDIVEADDYRFWVKTSQGYVLYDGKTDRFYRDRRAFMKRIGSRGEIAEVYVDRSKKYTWLCVPGEGCYVLASETDECRFFSFEKNGLPAGGLSDIGESKAGILLVYDNGLLVCVNPETLEVLWKREDICRQIGDGRFESFSLFVDHSDDIWLYSALGLWCYRSTLQSFDNEVPERLRPYGGFVHAIAQDASGKIWLGMDNQGILIYDKETGECRQVLASGTRERSLPHNTIYSLLADSKGVMWIGTYKKGIACYAESMYKFALLPIGDITNIAETLSGEWLLGTNDNGLIVWNPRQHTQKNFNSDNGNFESDAIVSILVARDGKVWVGTFRGGLACIDGSRTTVYRKTDSSDGLADDSIWYLQEDADGRIWIATLSNGLQCLNPGTGKFDTYRQDNSGLKDNHLSALCLWDTQTLLIGCATEGIQVMDLSTRRIRPLEGLGRVSVNELYKDSREWLWVAAREGLTAFDYKRGKVITLPQMPELTGKPVSAIAEDTSGNIWITVSNRIINIKVLRDNQGYSFETREYDNNDGLQTSDFNLRAMKRLQDGTILAGGLYGLNSFNPERMHYNRLVPKVLFTSLQLMNEPVSVGKEYDGKVILEQSLNFVREVNLAYHQHIFKVSFTTDNLILPEKTQFIYQLEGFHKEWVTLPKGEHGVTFTSLTPGDYVLKVKAVNSDGYASTDIAELRIVVHPPFWLSVWAFIFYTILVLGILVWIYSAILKREREKFRMKQIEQEAAKNEEINNMKFRFFTNISHELRTPLTLIIAPLEEILKETQDATKRKRLLLMYRNAQRLLMLVNQLLDFRKGEMNGHRLSLTEGDIVGYIHGVCDSFVLMADRKQIRFSFFSVMDRFPMAFDADKVGKVVMNLLSNAFKYTPEGGCITVSLEYLADAEEFLEIKVADTGIGISDEDKKHIFDRFYQTEHKGMEEATGTGIGLSLVRDFVTLHEGTVEVFDNGGTGTVFVVRLPVKHVDVAASLPVVPEMFDEGTSSSEDTGQVETERGRFPLLLVVDDNPDFREFMSATLGLHYRIRTASNGKEAWEMMQENELPDLVVSDVMMPEMDGNALCRLIKETERTSHIPVILLTAKQTIDSQLEGLQTGADDYVTKPFNTDILILRIQKLIQRNRSHHPEAGTGRAVIDPEPSTIAITSLDEKLIEKAVKYVEDNMSRSDLSVEELSRELGMSRVHLYKRLLQITGKTPIEFIRVIRLKRAAQLLRESQLHVSEVAFEVGFNNPKYFSRYFKEEFGVLPSVYQEKEGK